MRVGRLVVQDLKRRVSDPASTATPLNFRPSKAMEHGHAFSHRWHVGNEDPCASINEVVQEVVAFRLVQDAMGHEQAGKDEERYHSEVLI